MSHYAVHVPFAIDSRFYQKYMDAGLDEKEAMYSALVEGMDKSLGDIMDFLEKVDAQMPSEKSSGTQVPLPGP